MLPFDDPWTPLPPKKIIETSVFAKSSFEHNLLSEWAIYTHSDGYSKLSTAYRFTRLAKINNMWYYFTNDNNKSSDNYSQMQSKNL